ncbi:hypothetical protein FB107DRAFT_222821 [Schizophyllum commune]
MDDPPNPPASSGSKTFGIHKFNPEYCLGSGAQRDDRRRGYEDKYEDDALGEELGDNARIWRVMLDEGRANDAAMLQRFRDHLDVDLVFAGLFSAVLTTFVAQTSQTPSDTGDTTIALLLELIAIQRAWANNPRVNDVASFSLPPPSPTPSPWINRCWFLSLIFSLLAAFGAVVVRQWLQEYESDITGPPKRRALVRHYRRVGLEKYKVHLIVPILPMLLHVSLLLFFVGLTLYVRQSDRSMSNGIIALTAMIYGVYLATNILPVFRPQCPYRSPLSTGVHWAKSLVASLRVDMLKDRFWLPQRSQQWKDRDAHRKSWKEAFRTPDAHEWEAVLDSSDTMIPDSLDSMAQASSDLSVTPLVVQASSSLPIDHIPRNNHNFEDPRAQELFQRRILPWFINMFTTCSTVFDWVPGRENELQRMACILMLGLSPLSWDSLWWFQYEPCILRVLQALTSALLELRSTPTSTTPDAATLSMTLLALGNRLDDLDCHSKLLQNGALFDTITTAYSSLAESPLLAVLRLRPVIWHQALAYLRKYGRPMDKAQHFVIALWRSNFHSYPVIKVSDASRLHMACHAIESYVKRDNADSDGKVAFDDNLGFLATQFVGALVTTLGYGSIESALRRIGHPAVAAAFKSTFLARAALSSTADCWEADARLSATFAVSLFWLLMEVMAALRSIDDSELAIRVLNRHATGYCDALLGEIFVANLEHFRPAVKVILQDPALAILDISDILAAFLTPVLDEATSSAPSNQPADDMVWCLYLNALCAARANSTLVGKKFSDASRTLHSALISLGPTYRDTWKSELTLQLKSQCIPLAVALALKSTHGCKALAEWVDDLPTLVLDPNSGLKVLVPLKARDGRDLNWYRLFTSDPDKHIQLDWWDRPDLLPISELVSFEEAVERMQKSDAERAARKAQRNSRGDGAEADANDDAENAGRAHGDLENQGGAERTESETTDQLRTLGAWVSTSFKRVRPLLGTPVHVVFQVLPADASG